MLWGGLAVAAPAPTSQTPQSFRDCADCPEVVWVPAGSFMMGVSSEVEVRNGLPAYAAGGNLPIHKVTFAKRFAMGKYPVTVAQFRTFVQETGHQTVNSCTNQQRNDGHMIYEEARGFSWRDPGFPQTDNHPVLCVSWDDAMAYSAWLSKKTGHRYSLPNQSQYEYATRAGTTTDYFWGDGRPQKDDPACLYANMPDLDQGRAMGSDVPMDWKYRYQCSDGWAYTAPVGTYRPNPWGLHDMLGNIWEWTEDCWSPNHQGAPTDGSTRTDGDCDAHPSMGGSYGNAAYSGYAGMRGPRDADYRGHSWGFRIARAE